MQHRHVEERDAGGMQQLERAVDQMIGNRGRDQDGTFARGEPLAFREPACLPRGPALVARALMAGPPLLLRPFLAQHRALAGEGRRVCEPRHVVRRDRLDTQAGALSQPAVEIRDVVERDRVLVAVVCREEPRRAVAERGKPPALDPLDHPAKDGLAVLAARDAAEVLGGDHGRGSGPRRVTRCRD